VAVIRYDSGKKWRNGGWWVQAQYSTALRNSEYNPTFTVNSMYSIVQLSALGVIREKGNSTSELRVLEYRYRTSTIDFVKRFTEIGPCKYYYYDFLIKFIASMKIYELESYLT
jgi:hypothetical protein